VYISLARRSTCQHEQHQDAVKSHNNQFEIQHILFLREFHTCRWCSCFMWIISSQIKWLFGLNNVHLCALLAFMPVSKNNGRNLFEFPHQVALSTMWANKIPLLIYSTPWFATQGNSQINFRSKGVKGLCRRHVPATKLYIVTYFLSLNTLSLSL
jgi:hypothetical protein